jgi:hypothetical protein
MKEAIGKVVSKPYAGSQFHRPAVQLGDGTWYWLSQPPGGTWPVNPGQIVRIRYSEGDQFCVLVEDAR